MEEIKPEQPCALCEGLREQLAKSERKHADELVAKMSAIHKLETKLGVATAFIYKTRDKMKWWRSETQIAGVLGLLDPLGIQDPARGE